MFRARLLLGVGGGKPVVRHLAQPEIGIRSALLIRSCGSLFVHFLSHRCNPSRFTAAASFERGPIHQHRPIAAIPTDGLTR
jgi:hypothetical protein